MDLDGDGVGALDEEGGGEFVGDEGVFGFAVADAVEDPVGAGGEVDGDGGVGHVAAEGFLAVDPDHGAVIGDEFHDEFVDGGGVCDGEGFAEAGDLIGSVGGDVGGEGGGHAGVAVADGGVAGGPCGVVEGRGGPCVEALRGWVGGEGSGVAPWLAVGDEGIHRGGGGELGGGWVGGTGGGAWVGAVDGVEDGGVGETVLIGHGELPACGDIGLVGLGAGEVAVEVRRAHSDETGAAVHGEEFHPFETLAHPFAEEFDLALEGRAGSPVVGVGPIVAC